jgi:hypothetical protein
VSQRAGRDGLLVTAGELAAELAQDRPADPGEPPVLLDVRWRLAGHIAVVLTTAMSHRRGCASGLSASVGPG